MDFRLTWKHSPLCNGGQLLSLIYEFKQPPFVSRWEAALDNNNITQSCLRCTEQKHSSTKSLTEKLPQTCIFWAKTTLQNTNVRGFLKESYKHLVIALMKFTEFNSQLADNSLKRYDQLKQIEWEFLVHLLIKDMLLLNVFYRIFF